MALFRRLIECPAFRDLSSDGRNVLFELLHRYEVSNNGRIPLSVREAAERLLAKLTLR